VHANGNVVPCDRDWAGENVMGNVFHQDVMEIWNGEKFKAFRAKMKSRDKPAMCKGCKEGRLVNARSQPHIQVNMFKGAEVYHDQ
jgi:radical SAM protein with 4Fe4S-binding SPASM domain